MGKTYVVFVGRNSGIYRSCQETHLEVNKFSGAVYKSYLISEEAVAAFTAYKEKQSGSSSSSASAFASASVSAAASVSASAAASVSTTAASSTIPDQYEKLAKLIDAQVNLAREHRKQCLKAAEMFEEIEQQLKSLRVKEEDN